MIERNQQERHIREIVAVARDQMDNADELEIPGRTFSSDEVRHTIFVEMHARLESALASANRIKFKQVVQLKKALWGVDLILKEFSRRGIREINVGVQNNLFEELERVKWLKLTE